MTLRAILVDLDGTLIDTWPDLLAAALVASASVGIAPDAERLAAGKQAASGGARRILEALGHPRPVAQETVDAMIDYYSRNLVRASRSYVGVEEWFDLAAVAVVTNKPLRLAEPLLHAIFPGRITALVGPETAGAAKPNPAPTQHALRQLDARPSEAVMIGDDERDWCSARAAGVPFIAAGWGYGVGSWMHVPDVRFAATPQEATCMMRKWASR